MSFESDIIRRSREESLDLERKEEIIGPKKIWGAYDSHLSSFDSRFGYEDLLGISIPDNESAIGTYLDTTYKEEKGGLVAVEIGGPGSNLFNDLAKHNIFKQTAGFTLTDRRDVEQKSKDSEINHDVIKANIFSSSYIDDGNVKHSGWQEVENWVKENGKPKLIIESALDGLPRIDRMPEGKQKLSYTEQKASYEKFFILNLLRWYKILDTGGTILAETIFEESERVNVLLEKLQPYIDIRFRKGYLFIKKRPDSPENLEPFLRDISVE